MKSFIVAYFIFCPLKVWKIFHKTRAAVSLRQPTLITVFCAKQRSVTLSFGQNVKCQL